MTKYSIEEIKPLVDKENLTGAELELLPYVVDGLTPQEIAEALPIPLADVTIRKRLTSIYNKFKVPGAGPGKLEILQNELLSRINNQKEYNPVLIVWSGPLGQELAKRIQKEILIFRRIEPILSELDINTGKIWREEIEKHLEGTRLCIACLSNKLYDEPLVNAGLGFLDGKIGQCKIVAISDNQEKLLNNSSLSYFSRIRWGDISAWSEIFSKITNQAIEDAELFIEARFEKCKLEVDQDETSLVERQNDYIKAIQGFLGITDTNDLFQEADYLKKIIDNKKSNIQDVLSIEDDQDGERDSGKKLDEIIEEKIQKSKEITKKAIKNYLGLLSLHNKYHEHSKYSIDGVIANLISDDKNTLKISAIIVRVIDEEESLEEWFSWKSPEVGWGQNDDPEKRDRSKRKFGEGLVSIVFAEKEPLIKLNIDSENELRKFKNKAWIKKNKFKSFAAFPLFNGDDNVIGTFTMYFKENYDIRDYPNDYAFIECLTYLLSNVVIKQRSWEALGKLLQIDQKCLAVRDTAKELAIILEKAKEKTRKSIN